MTRRKLCVFAFVLMVWALVSYRDYIYPTFDALVPKIKEACANLTLHTEALLDVLLLNLDSDGDGSIFDEPWYQVLALDEEKQDISGNLDVISSPTIWRLFYSDGAQAMQEVAMGANGTFLEFNGTTSAPAARTLVAGDIPDISVTYVAITNDITNFLAAMGCDASGNLSGFASISTTITANPALVLKDSNCPGAEDTDKEVFYIEPQFEDGAEDAENTYAILSVLYGGTKTGFIKLDGKDLITRMLEEVDFEKDVTMGDTDAEVIHNINAEPDAMSDDTYNGITIVGIDFGETVGQWGCVFLAADGKVDIADADAAGEYETCIGIVTAGGNDTDPAVILTKGIGRNEGWTGLTVGGEVFLGDDGTGAPTQTAPSTSTDCVKVIGVAISDSEIYFNFTNHYVLVK